MKTLIGMFALQSVLSLPAAAEHPFSPSMATASAPPQKEISLQPQLSTVFLTKLDDDSLCKKR